MYEENDRKRRKTAADTSRRTGSADCDFNQQPGRGSDADVWIWHFSNFQCTICIFTGIATADSWNLDLCFSGKPDPFSNDIVVERSLCRITYSVS